MTPKRCWFCPGGPGINQFSPLKKKGELCDNCRALLSDFLVWLGRSPLPERAKIRK